MQLVAEGKNRKIIAGAIILVAIVLVVIGTKLMQHKQNAADVTAPSATTSTQSSSTSTDTQFKDGEFSAAGNYDSPGGTEAIKVSVTMKNGVVTDSSVAPTITTDDEASDYQQQFIRGYKTQVVGKKITAIHLSRISGSSLTSQGFNNALDQIISQAKT
jgi:hypothetical protein